MESLLLRPNMEGFPDWMSCEPTNVWCIGGFGDKVQLINQAKLYVAGSVPLVASDPLSALRGLGLDGMLAESLLKPAR